MKFITALFLTLACISPAALADAQEDDFGEIREFDTKPLTRAIVEQLRKGGIRTLHASWQYRHNKARSNRCRH